MSFLSTVVAFLVALGVLIVVHEYGHYLVARLCGVKVLRFSVGFGRPLVSWRTGRDRTEWVIAAVPFGGYVKLPDEREGDVAPGELGRAFNRQAVWRRFLIVLAGPLFNFVFAVAVYAGLFMHGLPEARPVLDAPPAGTAAAAAGLRRGDVVRAVDGAPIATWEDLRWQVLQAALQGDPLRLEVEDERGNLSTDVVDMRAFAGGDVEGDAMERLGLRLYRPEFAPVIGRLIAGGPAERAGLAPGDRVVAADGVPITTWTELVEAVRQHPGSRLRLTVQHDGARRTIEVVPKRVSIAGKEVGQIGAAPQVPAASTDRILIRVQRGPLQSFGRAIVKTAGIAGFSLKMIGKMIIGQVSWKNLSGPVTIADFAGQSAQLGWIAYLTFLALISISLGVLNLLPIPLLDGGHLMYYAVEIVKGRPVSERAMELGQRVGLALLLIMMAFAFYNDFNRLLSG